ncbi:site-specific integrase [Latilactobacillus curvatus]|uniref:site-specific integrase n=1 Tax=Latilactobacillus curvatus TaxID=28038 RepID=UPI00223C1270|nr:site-specific integrase [Latilactobacillus curvatus]MCS8616358.1 site-specific integrase [Latilactobacillus curvatus]
MVNTAIENEVILPKSTPSILSVEDENGNFRRVDRKVISRKIRQMTFYDYYSWYVESNKKGKVSVQTLIKYELTGSSIKQIAPGMLLVDLENNRINLQWLLDKYGENHRKRTWLGFKAKILQALRYASGDGYIQGVADSGLVMNTVEQHWDEETKEAVHSQKLAFSATNFTKVKSFLDFKLDDLLDKEPVYRDESLNITIKNEMRSVQSELLIMAIAIHTGMRFSEVLGVTEDSIANDKISVTKTWDYKRNTGFMPTKNTSSIRDVAADQTIINLINRYIKFKHKYFPTVDVKLPLILEDQFSKIHCDVINHHLRNVENKLNVDRLSFHKLRHSYASFLIFQGIPEAVIAKQLGHTDTNMLHRVYGHLLDEQAEAGAMKIRGMMG